MKKLSVIFVILLAFVMSLVFVPQAGATRAGVPNLIPYDDNLNRASVKPEVTQTLLNAVTTYQTGSNIDLGFTFSQFAVQVAWGVAIPTAIQIQIEGSVDGTTWRWIDSETLLISDSSDWLYFITAKPVRYIRAVYAYRVGGSTSTTITVKVTAGGN